MAIRAGRVDDVEALAKLMRGQPVRPHGGNWRNFVLAERAGRVVGAAQLRPHNDGVLELSSLVVEEASRGQGIAARLLDDLLYDRRRPIFMITAAKYHRHYAHWGFEPIDPDQAPFSIWRYYRLGQIVGWVFAKFQGRSTKPLVILRRPPFPLQQRTISRDAIRLGKAAA